jgi:multicomponent Na+:H+ antiporter subunit D
MQRTLTISLDTDWVWRHGGRLLANGLNTVVERFTAVKNRLATKTIKTLSYLSDRYLGQPHKADSEERSVFARSWTIGTTALWISGLLSAYVLAYYL